MEVPIADLNQSNWSETDSSNNQASPNGWTTGTMLPSQVEPTARAMMGAVKRFYDHVNATVISGGTANVQTLTYSVAPTALGTGDLFIFQAGFTNTGSATLNINALGAKTIRYKQAALIGNEIRLGGMVAVVYDGTYFQLLASSYPAAYAFLSASPADPTGTTSPTGVMMGIGYTITPTASGKIRFAISGVMFNNVATAGVVVALRYGTGAAPANGDALTGTVISGAPQAAIDTAANAVGFEVHGTIGGLTIGTAYWFDLSCATIPNGTVNSAGVVHNLSCDAVELP